MISILILKSFCAWFMILNHQNLPANHQILQVALQAAEQQLLRTIYFTDSSCSQSYLILECFHQNSFSYVIDCQFSHRETSCTVCRSCHPCCVVWTPVSAVCSTTIFLFLKPKMRFLLQSLTQHISWNGCRLTDNRSEVSQAFVEALQCNSL